MKPGEGKPPRNPLEAEMAIDFSKIRLGPRRDYLYKCSACRHEDWYTIKIPAHFTCQNLVEKQDRYGGHYYGECRSRLVLIDVRERERK